MCEAPSTVTGNRVVSTTALLCGGNLGGKGCAIRAKVAQAGLDARRFDVRSQARYGHDRATRPSRNAGASRPCRNRTKTMRGKRQSVPSAQRSSQIATEDGASFTGGGAQRSASAARRFIARQFDLPASAAVIDRGGKHRCFQAVLEKRVRGATATAIGGTLTFVRRRLHLVRAVGWRLAADVPMLQRRGCAAGRIRAFAVSTCARRLRCSAATDQPAVQG